jgi:hypothetical protein
MNMFAGHFLIDAFSAGHLINQAEVIAQTTISSSEPICTSSTTARCNQQPRPYPCSAHVVFRSSRFQSSRSRNPRRGAACALDQTLTSPTATAEAPHFRSRAGCRLPAGGGAVQASRQWGH